MTHQDGPRREYCSSEDPDVVSSTGHAGDRNLVWAFSNHGIYELSTPLMGEPKNGLPQAK
ncbi:hypothetical protein [Brevibacillus sp. AY1]|uniref:hypothetical protein n=1 Tax=Brevibacillus sp. AY1 TaxID=2807621 RepID=UPI002455ABDC|nr:hypothetical protein [Brevibacillus sp. AY1]MDH4617326.1 hypothetical protein [Brevibacillus sp. AY1]